jgi:hypothetical protein
MSDDEKRLKTFNNLRSHQPMTSSGFWKTLVVVQKLLVVVW